MHNGYFCPLKPRRAYYSKSATVAEILFVGVYQSSCPDQKENISRILMQQLLEV